MSEEPAPAAEAVKKGDFVLLDYEIWAEGQGKTELVDTTRREVAEQAQWTGRPEGEFGPSPHLIGREYFPAALEQAIASLKVGESLDREFSPAEAFGERDPKLIELFSMREISRLPEMRREDATLEVGTTLHIQGRRGRVVSFTAGRVRVDFNNPLAGKKIRAKVTVRSRLTEPKDIARAVLQLDYGHGNDFQVDLRDGTVEVRLPDRAKFDVGWLSSKVRVIEDLREHLKPASIVFLEEFKTPVPKTETPSSGENPSPSAPTT
jgi:FKBP-type peptidyl-prolyl cis-trans isomerase 2